MSDFTFTRILGVGHYIPAGRLSNDELASRFGISSQSIEEKTGVVTRAIATESLIDMAFKATTHALQNAQTSADKFDFILFATSHAHQKMPASANLLQARLENSHCLCLDVNAACSGFKYALNMADALIKSGQAKCGLIVGVDLGSSLVDQTKAGPSLLFGDAAGAWIVGVTHEQGILGHVDTSLSQYANDLKIEHDFMEMNGHRVYAEAVTNMTHLAKQVCQQQGIDLQDVHYVVSHQANVRILEAVASRLNLPLEKMVIDMADIGNTAAASIPVAFSRALDKGQIKRGDLIMLLTFAAGFSGGATLMRY